MREVTEAWELIDRPDASGRHVSNWMADKLGPHAAPRVTSLKSTDGATDVLSWTVPGTKGVARGGTAPTLAIVGRLGGVGARPSRIGTVSDADGAVVALAVAIKLWRAAALGDATPGDVRVVTHICPNAPTKEHPVPGQMNSPVPFEDLLPYECPPAAAMLSVDTTRGHRILNHTGFAITPTLYNGYILRVSEDLMDVMTDVTNDPPVILPVTMGDVSPSGNGVYHINSIMQPGQCFEGPLVGVATVASAVVRGSATMASTPTTLESTSRFCVEAARRFGQGRVAFYDQQDYDLLLERYGPMTHLVGRPRA